MHLLAINVGNSRTRFGVFRAGSNEPSTVLENTDAGLVAAAINATTLDRADAPVVMASVNNPFADKLEQALAPAFRGRIYRFGRELEVPILHAVTEPKKVGQDRLLNALGAYTRAKQACVVIDAGTAVTVDFVDGEGVFQGGAIAPGLNMMLRAMHEQTAALPMLRYHPPESNPDPEAPGPNPFGKSTETAMLNGVRAAVAGMTHLLVDRYAEFYGAYPRIIATGGDARAVFEGDPIVEHIVPDLTLVGIHAACETLLSDEHGDEEP